MNTIQDRQSKLVEDFKKYQSWEDRYKRIIEIGKSLPAYPEDKRTEDFKVKGCQSQVWLTVSRESDGRLLFFADSDAMIVKGLVAILVDLYSGATPVEILKFQPTFMQEIGLQGNLTPSRANGLVSMIKQIRYYATAFSMMGS